MRIKCPHCGASGTLPDHKIPSNGIKIACPKCKTPFFVQEERAGTEISGLLEQHPAECYEDGVRLFKQKRIDAAIEKFKAAIQLNPQHQEAYRYLALAYGQKKLWPKVSEFLQKAIQLNPNDRQSLKNLGVAYLQQKRFAEAEHVLQKVVQRCPDDKKAKLYLDIAMTTQKPAPQPTPDQPLVSSPPPRVDGRSNEHPTTVQERSSAKKVPLRELLDTGTEYLENAQYNKALDTFHEVVRLAPHNSDGYVGLGMVYEQRGERNEAMQAYQKALKINPDDMIAKESVRSLKKQQKKSRWKFWKTWL